MKICYKIEGDYKIGRDHWFILRYTVVDPSHDTADLVSERRTTFSKGDSFDIPFPVGSPDTPLYKKVTALATWEPSNNHIPDRGWMITVYYDSSGMDFGEAYRVIFEAKFDDIEMDDFLIAFIYKGREKPGKQPWGFSAAGEPGQHTELGETSLCRSFSPNIPKKLRTK